MTDGSLTGPSWPHVPITIGRASELTGLTAQAIRFYQERGLVGGRRDARLSRIFQSADLERLNVIAELRRIGLGLEAIERLVEAGALTIIGDVVPSLLATMLGEQRRKAIERLAAIDALLRDGGLNAVRSRVSADPDGQGAGQTLQPVRRLHGDIGAPQRNSAHRRHDGHRYPEDESLRAARAGIDR